MKPIIHSQTPLTMTGQRSGVFAMVKGRLIILSLAFVVAFGAVFLQVAYLVAAGMGQEKGAQNPAASLVGRGDIVDRNGEMVATNLQMASLSVRPRMILEQDRERVIAGLLGIFPDLKEERLRKRMTSDARFAWVKRGITPAQQRDVLALGQPGLVFEQEPQRIYPNGNLGGHYVGYTDVDGQGLAGVERGLNEALADGGRVELAMDVRLQHILRREIAKQIDTFEAKAGAGVIMDVKTGEVLAAVSLPDYDPNKVERAGNEERFNRYALGVYELGSLFKIFSIAALLEFTDTQMAYEFDAREPIKMGRFTINDFHAEDRILTVPEVFMFSSNIGSAMMGQMVGTEKLKKFYGDLGLMHAVETEIKEIGRPLVPSPWGDIHTLTASYGHGIASSGLQLTAAVSTIVNGGYAVTPRFVTVTEAERPQENAIQVLSEEASHKMSRLMRLVVSDGTGSKADVPGYFVGGKTGTAEKATARGYDRDRLLSSFVGVFPMTDPQYAILVSVDEPKGQKESWGYATGGWVAAPAVANIVKGMVSVLGLPPQKLHTSRDVSAPLRKYLTNKARKEASNNVVANGQ